MTSWRDTGDDQIYVVGHSQGTSVMFGYLNSSPDRAARVAKYIGIDGLAAPACPGGVECMGVWARGNPARALGTTERAVRRPGPHPVGRVGGVVRRPVRVLHRRATGDDARAHQRATQPADLRPRPQLPGEHRHRRQRARGVRGPSRDAEPGSERGPSTPCDIGARRQLRPARGNGASSATSCSSPGRAPTAPLQQHFYFEPFMRSNHLLRLNLSPIDSPLSQAIQRGPHTTVSIVRQKEWWGDNPIDPANVDTLDVSTRIRGGRRVRRQHHQRRHRAVRGQHHRRASASTSTSTA